MCYFVHPQIKLSGKNLKAVFFGLFEPPNLISLKQKLSFYFPDRQIVFTDMGRTAFRLIVEKLNLRNSEIIFPAYICDVFYPILKQYNIKPIFLDIDLKTFHIKIEDIKKKISPETKAILVCHTYGLPADIEQLRLELRTIRTSNLEPPTSNIEPLIIEDCAHSLGAKERGVYTGNLGDISFFSLYKQFPALRGGLLMFDVRCSMLDVRGSKFDARNDLPKTNFNFRDLISFLNCFSSFAFLFKKFGSELAPRMLRQEKSAMPAGINKVSLNLFSKFFNNFEEELENRKKIAVIFQEGLKTLGFEVQKSENPIRNEISNGVNNVFCYLSALMPKKLEEKRDMLVQKLTKKQIFCTRIWHTPIVLNPEAQEEYHLNLEDYPNAVEAAKRIINFPLQNYYKEKDIEKIVMSIRKTIAGLI